LDLLLYQLQLAQLLLQLVLYVWRAWHLWVLGEKLLRRLCRRWWLQLLQLQQLLLHLLRERGSLQWLLGVLLWLLLWHGGHVGLREPSAELLCLRLLQALWCLVLVLSLLGLWGLLLPRLPLLPSLCR